MFRYRVFGGVIVLGKFHIKSHKQKITNKDKTYTYHRKTS